MVLVTEKEVSLERISWENQFMLDSMTGRGFIVDRYAYQDKKLKIKHPRGIHSQRFGTDYSDDNAFTERYSCKCRHTTGKVFEGEECTVCKTIVKFVDVNVNATGWILLKEDKIIQPLYYRFLRRIVNYKGFTIIDLLKPNADIDKEGVIIHKEYDPNKPFLGIGVEGLYNRYEEILDFFYRKKKNMRDLIDMIRGEKHYAFSSAIPVYSNTLRPTSFGGDSTFRYINAETIYNNILKKASLLNKMREVKVEGAFQEERDFYQRQLTLYELQMKIQNIWDIVFSKIDAKSGHIRSEILGGRVNFSARNVIVPDSTLKADEIDVGYLTMLELFRYEIISSLVKMTNMTIGQASNEWFQATLGFNARVYNIMIHIIEKSDTRCIMNRNPTINFGSLMVMKIRTVRPEYNDNHTMSVPVFILRDLNADFDGDILNLISIKIKDLKLEFDKNFNPRKSLIISRNDGLFNDNFNLLKDQIIGLRSFNNI